MRDQQAHRELVLGLGKTGLSIARYFQRQDQPVLAFDDDPDQFDLGDCSQMDNCEFLSVTEALSNPKRVFQKTHTHLYVSPGVRPNHPLIAMALERGLAIRTDIDLYLQHSRPPTISVTGTNGKSTVATLLHHLLSAAGLRTQLAGNIGTPVLDVSADETIDYLILELSSFQLHYATLADNNHIGVLTNISSDHLDFHQSVERYIHSKRQIFTHNRFSVFFRDQQATRLPPSSANASFGYGRALRPQDFGLLRSGDDVLLTQGRNTLANLREVSDRPLCFSVNLMPALAVLAHLDLDLDAGVRAGLAMPLLDHRYQRIASDDDICWIDASKATNPHATACSLPSTVDNCILLLGGDTKGADLSLLNPYLQGIKQVVAYSPSAHEIVARLSPEISTRVCADLDDAVQTSRCCASAGDTVLLAPAAASQPQYRNYHERGQHFSRLVSATAHPGQ